MLPRNSPHSVPNATVAGYPPFIRVWGDDVGIHNISAYNLGLMGYRTPNIDRIAREGAIFTDAYAQQSCTAGRASFILGQHPFRTGLLTIGMPGSPQGIPPWALGAGDVRIAFLSTQLGKERERVLLTRESGSALHASVERLLGLSPHEMVGRSLAELLHHPLAGHWPAEFRALLCVNAARLRGEQGQHAQAGRWPVPRWKGSAGRWVHGAKPIGQR